MSRSPGAFEEAYIQPSVLDPSLPGLLASGAVSGHLETSLDQVVVMEAQQLQHSLNLLKRDL